MNLSLLWDLALRGFLLVSVAGLTALAMRRASAAKRHLVWLAALASLVLLPLLMLPSPRVPVTVRRMPLVTPVLESRPDEPIVVHFHHVKSTSILPGQAPKGRATTYSGRVIEASLAEAQNEPIDLPRILVWIWGAAVAVLLARPLVGLWGVAKLVRRSKPWTDSEKLRVGGPVEVRVTAELPTPATVGLRRPVVLLPEEAEEWSEERLAMVLRHEMAHIRRRDWASQLLAQVACAIHFFNPLAWVAADRLRAESELACDDLVLAQGIDADEYATELLDIARAARAHTPLNAAVVSMARRPDVEARLKSIVDRTRRRGAVTRRLFAGVGIGGLVVVGLLAIVQPVLANDEDWVKKFAGNPRKWASLPVPWKAPLRDDPNSVIAQNGVATLKNGVRVRLVGLTPKEWQAGWTLDGAPLTDTDEWNRSDSFHRTRVGADSDRERSFIVALQSPKAVDASTTGFLVDPLPTTDVDKLNPIFAGRDIRLNGVAIPAGKPILGAINVVLPKLTERCIYRFGIATGPWTTVTDTPNPFFHRLRVSEPDRSEPIRRVGSLIVENTPELSYEDGKGKMGSFPVGGKVDGEFAKRALLLDERGHPLDADERWDNNGNPIYEMRPEILEKTARIVIQTRPYEWVDFRDVPVHPNYVADAAKRLGPAIHGDAAGIAPGFQKSLPGGVRVSLASVSRAVLDGKSWTFLGQPAWRGDGEVLSNPSDDGFAMPVQAWGSIAPVKFSIKVDGAKDRSTRYEAVGETDRPRWIGSAVETTWPIMSDSLSAFYRPGIAFGDVRVGVATGAWQVAGRRSVQIRQLPSIPKNKSGSPQTGLTVVLSDHPTLQILSRGAAPIPLVDRPLGKVAKRVVAITKDGKSHPMVEGGGGGQGTSIFWLPARHGEWTEAYNPDFLASDVKEIQIQTRPYEWVEFKNVPLKPKMKG